MSKYEEFITDLLVEKEYIIGSRLAQELIQEFNIKEENARKIIARAVESKSIKSSKPLSFGKGQFLYCLPKHRITIDAIMTYSKDTRKPLYRLLKILLACDGVLSFYEGLKITASPEVKTSSKVTMLKDLLSDLIQLKIVVERKDSDNISYILQRIELDEEQREDDYMLLMNAHKEEMRLDALFIPDVLRWLKETNIINILGSYRSTAALGTGASLNGHLWDAYSYTRTTGINDVAGSLADTPDKQTMVALDVVASREYQIEDFEGFLERCRIYINAVKGKPRKIVPIIVYNEIDEHTLSVARKMGFVCVGLRKIYGANISKLLKNITSIYSSSEDLPLNEKIEAALHQITISGLTDQLKSIKGILFEALMNPLLTLLYPRAQIQPGKKLKHPTKEEWREFDYIVISSHPQEIVLIELKGYAGTSYLRLGNSSEKSTLRYFYRGSVQLANDYYKADLALSNYSIKASFITSGNYHSECKDFIDNINNGKMKPSEMHKAIFSGTELIEFLKKKGLTREAHVINEYYIKAKESEIDD